MTNSADLDQLASSDLHCLLKQGMSCSAREGLILSTRYGNVWDVDIPGGGNTSTVSNARITPSAISKSTVFQLL